MLYIDKVPTALWSERGRFLTTVNVYNYLMNSRHYAATTFTTKQHLCFQILFFCLKLLF